MPIVETVGVPPQPVTAAVIAPPVAAAPVGFVEAVLSTAASQVANVVKPTAAAAVAVTFGFPLLLMLAVVGFLVGQSWVDQRDPKLRAAPQAVAETVLGFEEENQL